MGNIQVSLKMSRWTLTNETNCQKPKKREDYWRRTLSTYAPFGFNVQYCVWACFMTFGHHLLVSHLVLHWRVWSFLVAAGKNFKWLTFTNYCGFGCCCYHCLQWWVARYTISMGKIMMAMMIIAVEANNDYSNVKCWSFVVVLEDGCSKWFLKMAADGCSWWGQGDIVVGGLFEL